MEIWVIQIQGPLTQIYEMVSEQSESDAPSIILQPLIDGYYGNLIFHENSN